MHCKDTKQKIRNKFPEKVLREHSPNFHFHVSVSHLHIYSYPIGLRILLQENMWTDPGNICTNRSQARECGNWDWGRAIPRKEFRCNVLSNKNPDPDPKRFIPPPPIVLFCVPSDQLTAVDTENLIEAIDQELVQEKLKLAAIAAEEESSTGPQLEQQEKKKEVG
jgi:hypothetical protein